MISLKEGQCWLVFGHYTPIFFKLGMMIKDTNLYILISVWMTLIFIQGNNCIRYQKLCGHLHANLHISLDEIQCVATTCWFAESHAKFILHK